MTTTIDTKADVYSRPNARFDGDGTLEIRASAVGNCRRALWYEATGYAVTNPRTEESLTVLEAGNALEPVVLRAMRRAGWDITSADPSNPQAVSLRLGPNLTVSGHVDATGIVPIFGDKPSVIEVKTRGPEAFKRWQVLGAERSHPESVWQAALYTFGTFGEARDAVIATMDTGSRVWDYEVIPAERVERAFEGACQRLGQLGAHHVLHGPDPDSLPERDFSATDWQCQRCPFLNTCLPGMALIEGEPLDEPAGDTEPVTDDEARAALREYETAQEMLKPSRRTSSGRWGCCGPGWARRVRGRPGWRGGRRPAPWAWSRTPATSNCSDWSRYGLGEDGVQGMVGVAASQPPGAEPGSEDTLGFASPLRTGPAADLPAHHRWGQAALRRVVVRRRPGISGEGEQLRQEAFHPLAQHPHGRIAAHVRLADGP